MSSEWWRESPNVPRPLKYWLDLCVELLDDDTEDMYQLCMKNLRFLLTEIIAICGSRRKDWISNTLKREVNELKESKFLKVHCHPDYLYMVTQLLRALNRGKAVSFAEIEGSANRLLRRMEKDNFFSCQLQVLKKIILETDNLDEGNERMVHEIATSLLSELLSRGYSREYLTQQLRKSVGTPTSEEANAGPCIKESVSEFLDTLLGQNEDVFEVEFGLEGLVSEQDAEPLAIPVGDKTVQIVIGTEKESTSEQEVEEAGEAGARSIPRETMWVNFALVTVKALDRDSAVVCASQGLDIASDWLYARKLYIEGVAVPSLIQIEPRIVTRKSNPDDTERIVRGTSIEGRAAASVDKAIRKEFEEWFSRDLRTEELAYLKESRDTLGRAFHWSRTARSSPSTTSRFVNQWFAVEHLMQPNGRFEDTVGVFERFSSGMAAILSITLLKRECSYLAARAFVALKEVGSPLYAELGECVEEITPERFLSTICDDKKREGVLDALRSKYVYLERQIKRFTSSISSDGNLQRRIEAYRMGVEQSLFRMWRARCVIAHGGFEFYGQSYFIIQEYSRLLRIYSKLVIGILFRYFEKRPPVSLWDFIGESKLKYDEIVERLGSKRRSHPIKVADIIGIEIL